jgi:hypothetical protein
VSPRALVSPTASGLYPAPCENSSAFMTLNRLFAARKVSLPVFWFSEGQPSEDLVYFPFQNSQSIFLEDLREGSSNLSVIVPVNRICVRESVPRSSVPD